MTTRCKFVCHTLTISNTYQKPTHGAKLSPVYGGSEENKAFYEASPAGSFELSGLKNQPFEVGEEYFIDFTKAPKNG